MPPRHRRMFSVYGMVRATVGVLLVIALVGVLAFGAAILLIDPNAYKPEIEAAAKRATGRTLALRGPMRIAFGLPPWLVAEDIALSNPGGASRQDMVTVDRAEARVALWPLLIGNIDLTDLTVIRPNLLLERDGEGRGNWRLAPEQPGSSGAEVAAPSGGQGGAPASQPAAGTPIRSRVAFQSIHLEQARIGWLRAVGTAPVEVSIPHLDADASGPNGTMLLSGTISSAGRTFTLGGEVGSFGRLFDSSAAVAWPVRVVVKDKDARLAVHGGIGQPTRGRGLDLQFDIAVSDFTGIVPFLPQGVPVPHDANGTILWGDAKQDGQIGLTGATLHIGALRLPDLLPGVDIAHADLTAPALDRPVHLDIEGASSAGDTRLVMNAAPLGDILPGTHPANPVPIDVTLEAGRSLISAKGTLKSPTTLEGVSLDVFARLPDVAAFGRLIQRDLPPLSQVAFEGQVIGDLTRGGAIGIRKGTLTLPEAQVAGDLDLRLGVRPSLHAVLTSPHFDLDSLLADLGGAGRKDQRAAAPAADAGTAPPPPATPTPRAPPRLIPDEPFDLGPLDRMDGEVQARIDSLQYLGVAYTQLGANALLRDGKLLIDPVTGMMPGGPVSARLSIDSRAADAPMALTFSAEAVRVAPLLALIGDSAPVNGSIWIGADLQAAGRSPHALAATLDGHLGIASTDSELDNRLLLGLMRQAKLPEVPLSASGLTKLRCVALRLDALKGVASIGAMVVDAQRLVVMGGGSIDFGQEMLAMQLRPVLRLGGGIAAGGIVVPIRVGGSFLDPKVAVDASAKGGPQITGDRAPDACIPALAAVRAPGTSRSTAAAAGPPPPAAAPAAPGTARTIVPPTAMDVLKELLK